MGDSIVIFLLALMLFGPKKLPQLARQLGKLMAEFRKASNDFRMQMEDELRIEEQKEHQAKVDALAPPPSSTPDPTVPTEDAPHPHMPADGPAATPIAESGELKMMPPNSGLPLESSSRGRGYDDAVALEEHTIGAGIQETNGHLGVGFSSEEPAEEPLALAAEAEAPPPPDRSHPVTIGEAERATHA